MPSSRRTTGRGGAGAGGAGAGDAGGGDGDRVPRFMGNNRDHNPRELRSWARRTGFHPSAFFSGESNSSFASSAALQPPPPPPPASSRRPPRPPPERDPDLDAEDDLDPAPGRGRGSRPRRRIDLRGELQIPPGFGREEAVPGSAEAEPDARRGGARGDATRRNGGVERGQAPANAGRNGNGALADADARKKAEDAEAKRKAEEAEAEARRKKEDEERDAELAAYYQEQWANEDEGAAGAAAAAAETAPLYEASGLRCGVTENPGWGEFAALNFVLLHIMANCSLHFAHQMFSWSSLDDTDVLGIINSPPDSDSRHTYTSVSVQLFATRSKSVFVK
jgi:solute carrier family 23 (nucleobase transporter), member 1